MHHKKNFAAVAVAAAMGIVVTGCSSGGAAPQGPVELSLWTGFTGGDAPGYEQIVKDFNASQKRI
ncbi:MAG: ABC transporter substrate-binding protein, partial [Hamadaea sp.]|nr:ABC transporter substrate-binding protein [Hamadaea sp.]